MENGSVFRSERKFLREIRPKDRFHAGDTDIYFARAQTFVEFCHTIFILLTSPCHNHAVYESLADL